MIRLGAILIGGQSRRMGYRPKGLLPIQGCPAVEHIAHALSPISEEVVLIGNQAAYDGLPWRRLPDCQPGLGPVGGILTALRHAGVGYCAIVACDMPFVSTALFEYLCRHCHNADVVVPAEKGHAQPLCALWHARIYKQLDILVQQGHRAIKHLLTCLQRIRYVEITNQPFYHPALLSNLNTPADWAQISQPCVCE